jgi:hypothetical protein
MNYKGGVKEGKGEKNLSNLTGIYRANLSIELGI